MISTYCSLRSHYARSPFGRKQRTAFCGTSAELPTDSLVEEETVPGYKATSYFPVDPGYIFNNRYEALAKIGWGTCSTVWLVRDLRRWKWQSEHYLTLKIGNCDFQDPSRANHEFQIERRIAHANPRHVGCHYLRTFVDHFEEQGPNGTHICLAYESMREPLWLLLKRCRNQRFTVKLSKGYLKLLLMGLDYLHSECNIIHTGKYLKLDNILVGFEQSSPLEDFAQAQVSNPMARKVKDGHTVYRSNNDFGHLRSFHILPKITNFGIAHGQKDPSFLNRHPIQPDHYRAPEVILGAGWAYSADIWNLGLLMWNLLEARDLFTKPLDGQGKYHPDAHLAEMIALLGPPPKDLVDREREGLKWNWEPPAHNDEGKLCSTASEFYGGPFFDENGTFLHEHLIPRDLKLEDTVTTLDGEQKEQFLLFARKMLQWLPEDRKTAKELLEDPWLSAESTRGS
ncbi:CMGC/SRPK protein kinase [Polytolypa hystricis UAMH7299]|uniref:non-specific serine/threonine protein kinase n=1 Tax=Polytolypa hystricis (strain UAMH7299) TaxID=1447883 RepID=A0A2B7Z2S7_POLH7|nr:CMGC/SRPK protein kinase [Polytolypa hystricis UAMH7299]